MSSPFPPDYASTIAWADQSCAAISDPLFDFSLLPVNWNDPGRAEPLLTLVRKFAEEGSSWHSVMDNGGGDEVRSYGESIGVIIAFPVVVAGLALVFCWFPLWISRCCAHRCCRHSPKPYSRRSRRVASCCCAFMAVLTIVFICVGAVAGAAAVPAIETTMCEVDNFFRNTTDFLVGVEEKVGNLSSLATDASAGASEMSADLACLTTTFTTGAVATACADVTQAVAAATSVDSLVESATGSSASSLSPEWASTLGQLTTTQTLLCSTLPAYQPGVVDAQAAVQELFGPLGDATSGLADVASSVGSQVRGFRNAHVDYLQVVRDDIWGPLGDFGRWSGAGFFIPHIALVVLGMLGVTCMLATPRPKTCSANKAGVQTSGCAWVSFTIFLPLLFLLGAVCVFSALFMSDTGHLIVTIPQTPYESLGQTVCAQRTISFGGGQDLSNCELVQGCFADVPVSLWAAIEPSLPFNLTDIATQITTAIETSGFADGPPFNVDELEQAAAEASTIAGAVAGVSAATFGIPPSSAQHDPINTELAILVANLTTASSTITGSNDLQCAVNVSAAVPGLLDLAYAVLAESSFASMSDVFACGFLRTNVEAIVGPSLQGEVRDATGALACSLILAAVFGFFVVVTIIVLQVQYGDVGIEPGCPSCLRCCCCYKPGANATGGRMFVEAPGDPGHLSLTMSNHSILSNETGGMRPSSVPMGSPVGSMSSAPPTSSVSNPKGVIPVVSGEPLGPGRPVPWNVESV